MSSLLAIITVLYLSARSPPPLPVIFSAHARPGIPRGDALAQRIRRGGATSLPGPRLRREYDGEGGRVGGTGPARKSVGDTTKHVTNYVRLGSVKMQSKKILRHTGLPVPFGLDNISRHAHRKNS